jgi:hypothetical protein
VVRRDWLVIPLGSLAFGAACTILASGGVAAYNFVGRYNAAYHVAEAARDKHESDTRLCRIELGIDHGNLGFRGLMMACAADVQAGRPAKGHTRSILADEAWAKCMPEMDACDRALR